MSQPKRYTIQCFPHGFAKEDAKGTWVGYDDYAALAAENERLRKAGDEMMEFDPCVDCYWDFNKLIDAWNAAKEGRDAK